ncbi:MAG: ATP-binding cassette domain-containing protein [Betaproteobacteria bacterium]|nr:ATP-binding cassette domain-containing protein [Betaproteobacteria bacterium]
MIRLVEASKRYPGGHEALTAVSLDISAGEFVAVTGQTGAGKSTLLKLIAGLERATSGDVLVNGQNLKSLGPAGLAVLRRSLGIVFQDHKLLFDRSAFDNVMLPLEIADFPVKEAQRRARAALDKVGLLAREKANPISLSGGEQQRLCIARAIVSRPAILIADEPTGNLDADYASAIMGLFRSFNQVGVTVVLSTHDLPALATVQARRIELKDGRVLAGEALA